MKEHSLEITFVQTNLFIVLLVSLSHAIYSYWLRLLKRKKSSHFEIEINNLCTNSNEYMQEPYTLHSVPCSTLPKLGRIH